MGSYEGYALSRPDFTPLTPPMSKNSLRFRPIPPPREHGCGMGIDPVKPKGDITMADDMKPSDKTWAGDRDHATDEDHRSERRANLEDKGERQTRLEESAGLGVEGAVSNGSTAGGRLARDIGSQDELKRATERPGGATRVTKADEAES